MCVPWKISPIIELYLTAIIPQLCLDLSNKKNMFDQPSHSNLVVWGQIPVLYFIRYVMSYIYSTDKSRHGG